MFVEVVPSPKSIFEGVSITPTGIRVSKEFRKRLNTDRIGIKKDDDSLEIGFYPGGDHIMKGDGRIGLSKAVLRMPSGRYSFKRTVGNLFVCSMRVKAR